MMMQVCDTSDEEDPERSSQRNLHQTAGGGEREEGQLRARGQWRNNTRQHTATQQQTQHNCSNTQV